MPVQLPGTGTGAYGAGSGYAAPPTGSVNPQPVYLPTPAQGQATYYGGTASPDQQIQQILTGFQPESQQMYQQFMNAIAASGGNPAQEAQQFTRAETQGFAPTLANAIQFANAQQQQAGLANTGWANQFASQNLQNLLGQQQYNTGTYNQSVQQMIQELMAPYSATQNASNALSLGGAQNFPIQGGIGQNLGAFMTALGMGGQGPSGGYAPAAQPTPGVGYFPSGYGDYISQAGINVGGNP